jgi:hypothetical protein
LKLPIVAPRKLKRESRVFPANFASDAHGEKIVA